MSISFEFQDQQECFCAGTPVRGTVTFDAKYNISSVDELLIYLEGKGKVQWSEGGNSNRRLYSNKENYFRLETCLLKNLPNNQLTRGIHKFPFFFMLPKDTPQTVHFRDFASANITYMLKGRVVRSGAHMNIKHKQEIYVVGNSSLSDCPKDPTEAAVSRGVRIVCCWWCLKDGPIEMELVCDKTGYVCGESIAVSFNIENLSNQRVSSTSLKFYRQLRLVTEYKTRVFKEATFEKIETGSCRPRYGVDVKDEHFEIPPQCAPSLSSSKIIIPEYIVELHGTISGFNRSFKLRREIFVASVPCDELSEDAASVASPALPLQGYGRISCSDAPPPSYETATGPGTGVAGSLPSLLGATGDGIASTKV